MEMFRSIPVCYPAKRCADIECQHKLLTIATMGVMCGLQHTGVVVDVIGERAISDCFVT